MDRINETTVVRLDMMQFMAAVCVFFSGMFMVALKINNDLTLRFPTISLIIAGFGLLFIDEYSHSLAKKKADEQKTEPARENMGI